MPVYLVLYDFYTEIFQKKILDIDLYTITFNNIISIREKNITIDWYLSEKTFNYKNNELFG